MRIIRTQPARPRNCTIFSELIWINRFKTVSNTSPRQNLERNDCIRVFISLFSHRPTFNPFKCFCLPFKSSFIDENTCFCGLCVYKRIILKRGGREGRKKISGQQILSSNYARSNGAQKQMKTDFRRVRFSARASKIFHPHSPLRSWKREKIWSICCHTDWFNPHTESCDRESDVCRRILNACIIIKSILRLGLIEANAYNCGTLGGNVKLYLSLQSPQTSINSL